MKPYKPRPSCYPPTPKEAEYIDKFTIYLGKLNLSGKVHNLPNYSSYTIEIQFEEERDALSFKSILENKEILLAISTNNSIFLKNKECQKLLESLKVEEAAESDVGTSSVTTAGIWGGGAMTFVGACVFVAGTVGDGGYHHMFHMVHHTYGSLQFSGALVGVVGLVILGISLYMKDMPQEKTSEFKLAEAPAVVVP